VCPNYWGRSDSPKPHPAIKDITPEQWEDIIDKLMGFTYTYFNILFEGNIKEAQTPDGAKYKDIAQEIVLRVLQGSRRWNPDKDGELLPYMAGQVKSLVNHGFNSWSAKNVESMVENKEEESILEAEATQQEGANAKEAKRRLNAFTPKRKFGEIEEQESTNEGHSKYIQAHTSPNTEFVIIGKEFQIERDRFLETILEAVDQANDDDLWSLIEAYLDDSGEYKPREIASRLGISTTEFHNRKKRLVRCVKKHFSDQSFGIRG